MSKKILIVSLLIFGSLFYRINVMAADGLCVVTSSETCSTLKKLFDSQKTKTISVAGTQNVDVYAYSECSGSSCKYNYSGYSSYEDLLVNNVKCSNNEDYINVSFASDNGGTNYKSETNEFKKDAKVYFKETYQVECVKSQTTSTSGSGTSSLTLSSGVGSSSTSSSTTGSSSSTTGSSSSATGSSSSATGSSSSSAGSTDYTSSSTETSPETGVETYYIVLGILAISTYVFTILIKRYNLFKNI